MSTCVKVPKRTGVLQLGGIRYMLLCINTIEMQSEVFMFSRYKELPYLYSELSTTSSVLPRISFLTEDSCCCTMYQICRTAYWPLCTEVQIHLIKKLNQLVHTVNPVFADTLWQAPGFCGQFFNLKPYLLHADTFA